MTHVPLTFSAWSNLGAAGALAFVAVATLRAAPRKAPNVVLATYLALVATNFFANFLVDYLQRVQDAFVASRGPAFASLAVLTLDPVVLVYFACVFPRRRLVALSLPRTLALLVREGWSAYGAPYVTPFRVGIAIEIALGYSAAFALIVAAWLGEDAPRRRAILRILVVAFGTAVLPRVGAIPTDLGRPPGAATIAITSVAWAIAFGIALASARSERREVARVAGVTGALVALVTAAWVPVVGIRVPGYGGVEVTTLFTLRWFVFAALVSYAVLRYQVFDVDLRIRRATTIVAAAAFAAIAFVAGRALLARVAPGLQPPLPAVVGAVAALAGGVAAMTTSRALAAILRFPSAMDSAYIRQRKLEVLSAAVVAAVEEGRDPSGDAEVLALRRKLDLPASDLRALVAVTEAEARYGRRGPGGLAKGVLVADRYRVGDLLGGGTHARTYAARDEREDRDVVLKELRPEWQEDAEVRRRFGAEGALLARVASPHVVRVLDVVEHGRAPVLVLARAAGGSLADRLARGPLPPDEAARVARDVLDGLAAIHAEGAVHRDVKPANVLLDGDGRALVADLGVAHVDADVEATIATLAGRQPGTLAYMSPEQARGASVDARSDVYAVGAVLYEAVAGTPPIPLKGLTDFEAREAIQRRAPVMPVPGAPPRLSDAIARALAKEPAARFADARAFREAIAAGTPELRAP